MYKIERKSAGYVLTFSGTINEIEMQRWNDDSKKILASEKSPEFGVIVDMRDQQFSFWPEDSLKAELQTPKYSKNAFGVQALACSSGAGVAKMRIADAGSSALDRQSQKHHGRRAKTV